jgi:hypothetical protein
VRFSGVRSELHEIGVHRATEKRLMTGQRNEATCDQLQSLLIGSRRQEEGERDL